MVERRRVRGVGADGLDRENVGDERTEFGECHGTDTVCAVDDEG